VKVRRWRKSMSSASGTGTVGPHRRTRTDSFSRVNRTTTYCDLNQKRSTCHSIFTSMRRLHSRATNPWQSPSAHMAAMFLIHKRSCVGRLGLCQGTPPEAHASLFWKPQCTCSLILTRFDRPKLSFGYCWSCAKLVLVAILLDEHVANASEYRRFAK
jgi:hypothetical protein